MEAIFSPLREEISRDIVGRPRVSGPGEENSKERRTQLREIGSRSTDDKSSAAGRSMYAIDSPLHAPPRPRHRTNLSPTLLFRERSLNSFQANLRRDRETRMTNRWRATSRGILNARRGFQLTGAIAYKAGPDSFVD